MPRAGLGESLVVRAIPIIAPLLTDIPNEAEGTITVPVRSIYVMERARWPLVTVRVVLGDVRLQPGENVLWDDPVACTIVRGLRVPGSTLTLDILARSDPERYYITDALQAGLLADYMVMPDGSVVEGVVIKALRAIGLVVMGVRSPSFPEPQLGEGRPEGQSYRASLVVDADAWITWDSPGIVLGVTGASVTQEIATSVTGVAEGSTFWTVAAPS